MLEAFVLLVVSSFVALALFVHRVRSQRRRPTREEMERLREHIAWLEERQRHASERCWDDDMQQRLAAQLREARERLVAGEAMLAQEPVRR